MKTMTTLTDNSHRRMDSGSKITLVFPSFLPAKSLSDRLLTSTLYKKRNIWHRMKKRRTTEERMEWVQPLIDYGKEREERVREQREHPSSPHVLHVVRRVKPLKGRPWWEKQIMEQNSIGFLQIDWQKCLQLSCRCIDPWRLERHHQ